MEAIAPQSGSKTATQQPAAETLDLRGMEPPKPILAILKKVGELGPGARLDVRLDNQPMQLYDLLQQRGFLLTCQKQPDGSCFGRIEPRNHPANGH